MDPPPLRDPSKLFYQSDGLRRSIISAYWVLIFLAVPIWWHTTSIERLSLPSGRVQEETRRNLVIPITVCLDASLVERVEAELAERLSQDTLRWKGVTVDFKGFADCELGRDVYTVHDGNSSIQDRKLYFPLKESNSAARLADALTSLLAPFSSESDPDRRVAQYSPRYRLAFSLLNEDAAAGDGVLAWDIRRGLKEHINPILHRLNTLHNFTIESQVQYQAPLAFIPRQLEETYAVSPEDLTVFVNSAQWTLSSSSSNDPVLHFILFIPSSQCRPLGILYADNTLSPSNAFILPQWGGIIIHNPVALQNSQLSSKDLNAIVSSFAGQLLALLGVPPLPANIQHASSGSKSLPSDWQIDALLRRRTLENASGSQDTLQSIIKLVEQIDNMPVGKDVRDDVENALDALTKMYDSSLTSLPETFKNSARSFNLASKAFFSPRMLALLYFPAEHKYAVYAPLFASAIIPLVVAALREISAWRKERTARAVAPAVAPADKEEKEL